MKNKTFFFFVVVVFLFLKTTLVFSEDLNITADSISINKNNNFVIFKNNVFARDLNNNTLETSLATYDKAIDVLLTTERTKILTSEGFQIIGTKIKFDNKNKIISSSSNAKIIDKDNNNILVDMFNYSIDKNIFTSKGQITIVDYNKNQYNFSEIFIDEKKRKIVGTDVKAFFNQENFKLNDKNDPRFFANSLILSDKKSQFDKGVFTYCKFREGDKCPPWSLQSQKIEHNTSKKTIYYKNATLKIYDFPIFFFPRFSHPDPTVKRASGFLTPSFNDSANTGPGIQLPYYWAISDDRDLTFTPKLYAKEKLLMLTEYRQEFKRSKLIVDTSYTQGFKKENSKKLKGSKSHFFSNFKIDLSNNVDSASDLELNIEQVNSDSYFKTHNIQTTLVNNEKNILENNLSYHFYKNDTFFDADISTYEDLTKEGRKKYEYLFPHLMLRKNILTSDNLGLFDLKSQLKVLNYDVNKQTEFFVNDIEWSSNKWISKFGFDNQFKSSLKAVNYNADNVKELKEKSTELSTSIGFLSKIPLYMRNKSQGHFLTPKMLLRYSPGSMRTVSDGGRLKYANLFDLNKIEEIDVIENGLSTSIGFDYTNNTLDKDGNIKKEKGKFSVGQVISEKENVNIPAKTSLDQRFSDVVGQSKYNFTDNLSMNYNFSLDQNYNDFNYNELGLNLNLNNTKFNISYLEEKNHIGNQEYIKTGLDLEINDSNTLSFTTKRNILTSSAEFYDLSYNYINDCLKAGIVFRREFYNEKDVEAENSIMFTISILPFGEITGPTFKK